MAEATAPALLELDAVSKRFGRVVVAETLSLTVRPGDIVGIDIWEPSLALANENVARAGLDDRITIRRQDVSDLDDPDRYDCAWLPTFFFTEAKVVLVFDIDGPEDAEPGVDVA